MNTALNPFLNRDDQLVIPELDGALPASGFGRAARNPRITLNNGEIFINGTHASNTARVTLANSNNVRVELVGIETRDFSLVDVNSIRFQGRKGNDIFNNATPIPVTAFGNEGDDQITAGSGNDLVWGGAGNDRVYGGNGNDVVYGESGDDLIYGQDGNDKVYGAIGNDQIEGGRGEDFVTGDAGNDSVRGGSGNDVVHGWTGNDSLWGDGGDDFVLGDDGVDVMFGGGGNDWMSGGNQNDQLNGDAGLDEMNGGSGNDILRGGDHNDTLTGASGDDQMFGDGGNDILFGSSGNDELNGGNGNDKLYGQSDNDRLLGGSGKDNLRGGNGQDLLLGGIDTAADTLLGDSGQDHILYFSQDSPGTAHADLRLRFQNNGSAWTEKEMLVINEGLDALHAGTNNSELVKDYITGEDLTLEKVKTLQGGAAAVNVMNITTRNGQTTYDRVIKIANWNENDPLANHNRELAFIHEVAHNFDHSFELNANPYVGTGHYSNFTSKSGWTRNPPNTSQYTRSGDGEWWYLTSAQFYRSYSTLNPREDWATIWELHFDDTVDKPSSSSNLGKKLAAFRTFLAQFNP